MKTKTEAQTRQVGIGKAVGAALVLLALTTTVLVGQQVPRQLTVDDAIRLAKLNNPTYLSTRNDVSQANWQEREAYAAFLPRVTANGSAGYQEAGVQRIGTLVFDDQITDWAKLPTFRCSNRRNSYASWSQERSNGLAPPRFVMLMCA